MKKMDSWDKLWYYCPMPIKRRYGVFQKVGVALHLPRLSALRKFHFWRVMTSLSMTVLLFYSIFISFGMAGQTSSLRSTNFLNPFALVFIPYGFILIWIAIDVALSRIQLTKNKLLIAIILMIVIIPPVFAVGLNSGVFDSLTLANDSYIDLHDYVAYINVRNNGLRNLTITRIQVADIVTTNPEDLFQLEGRDLERGENYTFIINLGGRADNGTWITPTTLTQRKYRVVVSTKGNLTLDTEIEAKFSVHDPDVNIQAEFYTYFDYYAADESMRRAIQLPSIGIDYTSRLPVSMRVYSVEMGNLTLILVRPASFSGYTPFGSDEVQYHFELDFQGGEYTAFGSSRSSTIPNLPLNSTLFEMGETYDIRIRTMEDNYYMTSITLPVWTVS